MSIAIPSSLMLSSLAENDSGVSAAVRSAQVVNSQSELAAIVRLTEAEQAQRLYIQGHTVPQIAFSLSLSQQAVDSYLNISNAKG